MNLRAALAEFLATFTFIFVGAGSICVDHFTDAQLGLLGIAIAHGLALSIVVSATMNISGGHVNPAVTIAMLVTGRINRENAFLYIIAQILGGVAGGLLLSMVFAGDVIAAVNLGTPSVHPDVSFAAAVSIEFVLTFFLLFAIFGTAVDQRAPKIGGFGIGLTVAFDILVGGPLTGASMNPARTLGPALVVGFWESHAVYWIGPVLGAIVAALIYDHAFLKGREGKR
ncbi:MAG: MIP family channel protein [Bacteroidota bacterium]